MARDKGGNRLNAASRLNVNSRGQVIRDRVGSNDPNDFYQLRFDRPTSLNIELTGLTANANVQLLNRRGREIQTSASRGTRPESIYRNLAAGTYFVRVLGQTATRYALRLLANADTAGDSLSEARDLGIFSSYLIQDRGDVLVQDGIGGADRSDYYKLTVVNPGSLFVRLNNLAADANIQLLSRDGTLVQTSANPGTSEETIRFLIIPPVPTGDYYLHISPGNPDVDTSYQLTVGAGIIAIDPIPNSPPPLPNTISLRPVVTGLSQPVHITNAGDGSNRLFVVEQDGLIRISQNGTLLSTPFLDIRDRVLNIGEQGLLSIAFSPNYVNNGHFYVYYTNNAGNNVVARYGITSANVADPGSEQIILPLNHPTYANHNGGQIAFGSDGFLYIGTGDGGGGGDPNNNAQNGNSLLGKILRIDVESPGTAPYTIPSSNPFTAANDPTNAYRDEIWAIGLRNPWRFSFDRQTNDLYIGDVGQGAYEEIDFQPANSAGGQNYGWRLTEGSQPYNNFAGSLAGLTLPVAEYDHSLGSSITGGFVYRGSSEPTLQGIYFYGDFITGRIWGLRRDGNLWENRVLLDTDHNISTFGQDEQGNLYLASYSGDLYQIAT